MSENFSALEEPVLTYSGLELIKEKNDKTYAQKYKQVTKTLSSSAWQGTSAPYIAQLEVSGLTQNSDVQIVSNYDWTIEQMQSWSNAKIMSGKTESNKLLLKAYGEKPTVDLPIVLLVGSEFA